VTGRQARSAGPVLTSVLVALPVNAPPGMFFVALALDADFAAEGVLYSMAGAGPVLVYLTVFVQAARFRNFYLALPIGLAGWIFAAWLIAGLLLSFPTTLSTTGWMLNGHYGLSFVTATYSSARKALSL
jgi:hypothetical protein